MHLVVKIDQTKSVLVFQEQLGKPGMRDHRQKDVKLQVENHMQRMRGYKEIDQYQPKKIGCSIRCIDSPNYGPTSVLR